MKKKEKKFQCLYAPPKPTILAIYITSILSMDLMQECIYAHFNGFLSLRAMQQVLVILVETFVYCLLTLAQVLKSNNNQSGIIDKNEK